SHAAAARRGISAVLVEVGELGRRDEATALRRLDGLLKALRHLGVLDQDGSAPAPVREWVWSAGVTAEATGLWYPEFSFDADIIGEVAEGDVLGRIVDPVDGREHTVHAPACSSTRLPERGSPESAEWRHCSDARRRCVPGSTGRWSTRRRWAARGCT
ncbi:succinylglutamate desuccinylase/aspartoacylase family protein, partial [Streptomyces sp. NPDC002787]